MGGNFGKHLQAAGERVKPQVILIQSGRRVGLKIERELSGCGDQVCDQNVVQGVGPGRVGIIVRQPNAGQKRKRKDEQKRTCNLAQFELFAPVLPQEPNGECKE